MAVLRRKNAVPYQFVDHFIALFDREKELQRQSTVFHNGEEILKETTRSSRQFTTQSMTDLTFVAEAIDKIPGFDKHCLSDHLKSPTLAAELGTLYKPFCSGSMKIRKHIVTAHLF